MKIEVDADVLARYRWQVPRRHEYEVRAAAASVLTGRQADERAAA